MVTYVLDSSAVLRYLHDEAGAERVAELVKSHLAGTSEILISAPHWGEVAGITCKVHGEKAMELALARLGALGMRIAEVDGPRAVSAAMIKLRRGVPYVDAFGAALTAESQDRVLVTANFDLKPAAKDVRIEFLPSK